jgi:hypothetical protein
MYFTFINIELLILICDSILPPPLFIATEPAKNMAKTRDKGHPARGVGLWGKGRGGIWPQSILAESHSIFSE